MLRLSIRENKTNCMIPIMQKDIKRLLKGIFRANLRSYDVFKTVLKLADGIPITNLQESVPNNPFLSTVPQNIENPSRGNIF